MNFIKSNNPDFAEKLMSTFFSGTPIFAVCRFKITKRTS